MRKIFLMLILAGNYTLFAQGYVSISGTVTDSLLGSPVVNHPVTLMSDSTFGFYYYNTVYTDSTGSYFDNIPVMNDTIGAFYVSTPDCNGVVHLATILTNPGNNSYTQDFQICVSNVICQAFFDYELLPALTCQFRDGSTGMISNWYWEFGDGISSSDQNPLHTYTAEGFYTVNLTISNQLTGCYDFYSNEIYVFDSTQYDCHAEFSYLPDIAGPPSFQFFDLSTGSINSWLWDFGDGTTSQEQNPFHIFPEPGTYLTCLTVTGNNCTSTFCQEIVVSDTVFLQLYGQVFAGNFPMQQGTVSLFGLNPSGAYYPWGDPCPVDSNGIYFFTLVPEGIYYIQAVPFDSSNYFPTYYGDVINWPDAMQLNLGTPENPYNIQLVSVPANVNYFGEGSVSGQINNLGMERALAERANMILTDENTVPLGFCHVNSDGSFEFPSLDYGVYHLRAELAGVNSENMRFEITPEIPHLEVVMNYTGNSVLSVSETDFPEEMIKVFPNPVKAELNISCENDIRGEGLIRVYSMTGQQVYSDVFNLEDEGQIVTIPFNQIVPGIYNIMLELNDKWLVNKKIIKLN